VRGDIILIGGQLEVIISESIITVYPQEAKEEGKRRAKTGEVAQVVHYTAVKSRPLRK
jgi:hypothetical protein